jgi:integrase
MATMLASRTPTRDPFLDPALPTLADVLKALDRPGLAGRRDLPDLRSAVRTVARALGRPPEAIPAHPGHLRQLLAAVTPATHGLRPARWANTRSLLGRAMRLTGTDLLPGRSTAPLTPVWRGLAGRLKPVKALEIGLGRLMRFCSTQGIAPEEVDDTAFERFRVALEQTSLVRHPERVHRDTAYCWNRAATTVPGWPAKRLMVPRRAKQPYVLPPEAFPASFRADLAAWLARLAGEDLLAALPFRPVRPATRERRHLQVLQLASALVHCGGRAPAELKGLADLVEPAAVREALRFFLERAGGRPTRQIHELAAAALVIARHWVKVPEAQEQALRALAKRCDPGERGMTAKNRAVLRRLEDGALVQALLTLPDRLARGLARKTAPLTRGEALRLQTASAIAILVAAPMRISNLVGLRLDRHVLRQGGRGAAQPQVRLVISAEEVKNRRELDYPLPAWVVALLDLYLARARPLLQSRPGPWLFPGAGDSHKQRHGLSKQIAAAAETMLGLRLTPHQFRHACGAIYLAANPGGHEVVRNLLGHRSIETTIRYYAGMEMAAALRHYDAVILERRQAAGAGNSHG